jgi:glutathione S-transferase
MIQLCGVAASNYYNKVKLALLEKGVPFEEVEVWTSEKERMGADSPAGKIPYLLTEHGALSESLAISDYIEEAYPPAPMYPADVYARAKVREMCVAIELYLELPARRLYPQAFFGGTVSDDVKAQAKKDMERGVQAFRQLARFKPYVMGEQLSYADFAACVHLPVVTMATKIIYGADVLEEIGEIKPYLKMLKERPHFQTVEADRKQCMAISAGRVGK